jgi:hypothetical protein
MRKLLPTLVPILVTAAVIALLVVVLFYVYGFAHGLTTPLSGHASEWAEFGEYVGGTLGACYGFLAFIGVLITIRIQLSQLELDELQRLLASEAMRLDALFDSEPRQPTPFFQQTQRVAYTIYSLLELGAAAMISSDPKMTDERREERKHTAIDQIELETRILSVELPQFVELLRHYLRAGGSQIVATHYESKYALPVGFMDITGLLQSDSVRSYFRASRIAVETCRRWGIPAELTYAGRSSQRE